MAKKSYETYNTLGEQIDKASSGSAYDPNKDYSSDLKKQIASGADYDTVYNTLASRINKANSEGLSQYAWDSTTRDAIDYLLTFHETPGTYIDAGEAAKETQRYNDEVAAGVAQPGQLADRVAALEKPIEELRAQQNAAAAANPNKGGATTSAPVTPTVVPSAPSASSSSASSSSGSDYLKQMYEAKKEAGLAALKAAYDKNVATVDAAGKKIPGVYDSARNRTAASAAQAQRNFNQQAAASGLSSGTSAQAQLANSVALQGNLNEINTAESNALAELELQRTNLDTEYQNAVAQAEANGNYELAAALYEEKVRVDEYLAAQEAALRKQQQQDYATALEMAQYLFKNSGDASGLRAYGYTDDQIAAMETQWKVDNTPTAKPATDKSYEQNLELAKYLYQTTGDASGFSAYGYSPQQIAEMEAKWNLDNGGDIVLDDTPVIDDSAGYNTDEWITIRNNATSYLQQGDKESLSKYMDPILDKLSQDQMNAFYKLLQTYGYGQGG